MTNNFFEFYFVDYCKTTDKEKCRTLKFDCTKKSILKIGTDTKSDFIINELDISRLHAVMELVGNKVTLIDLGNEPGTMVNKNRINKCNLTPGDIISFGPNIYSHIQYKGLTSEEEEGLATNSVSPHINNVDTVEAKEKLQDEAKTSLNDSKDKIYLTAAHSCGKSTLARYISNKYQLPLITEVARMVLSEKELSLDTLRANLDVVNDYQWQVFERQLIEEAKYKSFVSDRCFDFLAYSAQHAQIASKIHQDSRFQEYLNKLKDNSSIVFFVRPSRATLSQDGVRESVTWDGIVAIDAQIKLILEMYNIRYFQINSDSLQERTRLIDNILELFLTKS